MWRTARVGFIALAVFAGLGALVLAIHPLQARGQAGERDENETPYSEGISDAMGELEWGMTKSELMSHFVGKVRSEYTAKIKKAPGAVEEARLRREMEQEIQKIRDSYTEFTGDSRWDVSFLQGEFTHNNGEAMIVVKDDRARNFYFLIDNHFWKRYRAFDQEVFAGATFDQFASALEKRFGEARERKGRLHSGDDKKHWLEWQDEKTRLRAVDQTRFYGFYSLVFEEKKTLNRLDDLRVNRPKRRDETDPLIEAVTETQDGGTADAGATR